MIAILLATYNSERYICEQLDSILSQTVSEWIVFIRDDGSTDGTLNIIEKYQMKWPNKIKIISDNKGSLKSYFNFIQLMTSVDSDYYMFCDHDDVWIPNKIEISISTMKRIEADFPTAPIVVHTDMKVVNQNLDVISESFWDFSRLLPNHSSFWELVSCNCVNGCTMLFNDRAKHATTGNERYCLMHDTLVAQSVSAVDGIIFAIKQPTVLYRQHFNNVIGASDTKRRYFIQRLESINTAFLSNYTVWKRACHIKRAPFFYFMWIKTKISILRFIK